MTCPVKMTPATTLWQDWGLGIMLCKAAYELELDEPPPLAWFLSRVRRHAEGFDVTAGTGLDVVTTVALFGPPLALLTTFLAVPYVVGYVCLSALCCTLILLPVPLSAPLLCRILLVLPRASVSIG